MPHKKAQIKYISAVPSQLEAVSYLEQVAKKVKGRLRLGGHSKGITNSSLCSLVILLIRKELHKRSFLNAENGFLFVRNKRYSLKYKTTLQFFDQLYNKKYSLNFFFYLFQKIIFLSIFYPIIQ